MGTSLLYGSNSQPSMNCCEQCWYYSFLEIEFLGLETVDPVDPVDPLRSEIEAIKARLSTLERLTRLTMVDLVDPIAVTTTAPIARPHKCPRCGSVQYRLNGQGQLRADGTRGQRLKCVACDKGWIVDG